VDRVADIVKGIRVGDPWDTETDIGPAVNAAAADRILGMIDRPTGSPSAWWPATR
jgi:aldehyde dehydrogenase (NAD+)